MKKHRSGIISLSVILTEFIVFLVWGFNMGPGDEMGYGLIVIYGIMPLTAMILSAMLSAKNSPYFFPVALLAILSHIFLPFFVYGSFEIGLSLCLSAIPYTIGSLIGTITNTIRNK